MNDIPSVLLMLAGWLLLQNVLLPWLGVPT
jgi:hypothetical protein